jgi:hypothetical protein
MTPRPTSQLELVEPLRSFLESFSQELTEQKFVPAFRDELKKLLASLDRLQQTEETLQQVSEGVERLREVFAPAGTKLLDGARDLETAMRTGAEQIRSRAADVLSELVQTHEKLEGSLRSEAGLLQEQTAASREAVGRAVAEIESRLTGLTFQLEGLCERLHSEVSAAENVQVPQPMMEYPVAAPEPVTATVEITEELRELIARSEAAVARELERHHQTLSESLRREQRDDHERTAKIDEQITNALSTVGPRIQDELDSAMTRLRDQIQTLILAETSAPRAETKDDTSAPLADLSGAIAASETRILREISGLQVQQKTQKSDGLQAEKILRDLTQGLDDAMQRCAVRLSGDSQAAKDSLTNLQKIAQQLKDSAQQDHERMGIAFGQIDSLVKTQREQKQFVEGEFRAALSRLDTHGRTLEQKVDEDRQMLSQLNAAMQRAEQAATTATELALSDSRTQRDKIEVGLKDLRERLNRGLEEEQERSAEILRHIAEAWTEALETLREFIQKTLAGRTDALAGRFEGMERKLTEQSTAAGNFQREIQGEIRRAGQMFEEKVGALKSETESFTAAMESHVKAVSSDVAALRAKQDQSLAVLREAIRANYDDNSARLKDVIESSYDTFVKQSGSLPQSIERFSHLLQSMHQGDQLSLQTIVSNTQNTMALTTEKFELLLTDSNAMKKFYPLLDKKLEKQAGEMDALRKSQMRVDKDMTDMKSTLRELDEQQQAQRAELKEALRDMQARSGEALLNAREEIADVKADIASFSKEDLPTFRRDISALLTSKFEGIEQTLSARENDLRKEMMDQITESQAASKKTVMIVAALVGLSMVLQLVLRLAHSGAAH